MEYFTFLSGTFVVYAVGDAGSTCCGPCQIVSLAFVRGNTNQGILKFVELSKGHATFKQIKYLTFLTGTFVFYAASDAGSTCCCFELLLTAPT